MKSQSVIFWASSLFIFLFLVSGSKTYSHGLRHQKIPALYVNPFIGASTSAGKAGNDAGLGKTFPGAATPFGMVQVSPNTITGGDNGSGYSYEHTTIEGFALTQMSGVGWYGDLGNFLVMPTIGVLHTAAGKPDYPKQGYRSNYLKKSEKASAGYYSVELSDYHIRAELTATPHAGMMRFTFPKNEQSRIQVDLSRRVGGTSTLQYVQKVNDHSIEGWMLCTPKGGGWGDGAGNAKYTVYFYAKFSHSIKNFGIWSADIPDNWGQKLENVESAVYQERVAKAKVFFGLKEMRGKHLGFFTEFKTKKGEQVLLKTGISFVSIEGARKNLATEIPEWNFDRVHQKAVALWNQALDKIKVYGGTKNQRHIFYTALYHTMIDPRMLEDVDGKYHGGDEKTHVASGFVKRSVFSGWDVFRAQFPLQTIINPKVVSDLIHSFINLASESRKGYFPRWEFLNSYSKCMIGNPFVSILCDAYAKGIRNYDVQKAYTDAKNTCKKFDNGEIGYSTGPYSISNTLEYSYSDWCMAQLARMTGNFMDTSKYNKGAQTYCNIFDRKKGWFRPREKNGQWYPWSKRGRLTDGYGCIESNAYQQGWFVPHDVRGMVALMGGKEQVLADLHQFFDKTPLNFLWNDYFNIANEPVHHVPFLFNRLGEPWETQKWTRIICKNAYKDAVEGLVGNDDCGQMSAWYVLASSGIYQICPGSTRFELTSPVFDKIIFRIKNGVEFTIFAKNNSDKNIYIQSAKLNGKKYNKCYIDYFDIIKGGKLELIMSNKPNKNWGV